MWTIGAYEGIQPRIRQSLKVAITANLIGGMLVTAFCLRGIIYMVPAFIFLPMLFGTAGLWLALPVAEIATLITCLIKR